MITQSTINIALLLGALTLLLPLRYFLAPYIVAACFIPADQRIIIADLDFTVLRILVVVGVIRLCLKGEIKNIKWNRFDKLVLVWVVVGAIIYVLQWKSISGLIFKCGILFDVLGLYWLFRQNIRSWDDIDFAIKILALCALITVPFVAYEWVTGSNPFAILGRVCTEIRGDRFRCAASFPHSIMLGLFWCTLMPIFLGLARIKRHNILYWAASGASIFIVCSTGSSTPLGTLAVILILLTLFRYRCYGRHITYGLCGLLFVLHIIMKAPVWHLIARANLISGSTGWHRYNLIDQAVNHFWEWALLGTRSTGHWGWGLDDVTNHYILEGVRGGFITLVLFIILLILAVKTMGRYSLQQIPEGQKWLAWCMCISILGHCISFIGVSYFGQIMMLLYLTFSMVGFVYETSHRPVVNKIMPVPAFSR